MLDATTYDVYVLGLTASSRGKLDWSLDGGAAFISGQDWYSSNLTYNVTKNGTLTVAAAGRHLLRATVNGKNASSSAYNMNFTCVVLIAQTLSSET
jgi:hypothetical protein